VYALLAVVFGPDDSATSYVVLANTPDVERVSLQDAREFGGRKNISAADGRLYVGSYDEPILERYAFTDDLQWIDEDSISFANQGSHDARPESLVNAHTAYAPRGEWDPFRTLWDPSELGITGRREGTDVPQMIGNLVGRWGGFDFEVRQGPPMRTVMYDDGEFFEMAPITNVVVYDPRTHEEERSFEVPCPGMYLGNQDEQGNTYMTSTASPVLALYGMIQGSCVRRITPEGMLDDTWQPDVTEWTGGRQLSSFTYIGAGKAIGNVLHHEELQDLGADFAGAYDPDVYDAGQNGNHYRAWFFDLEAETAAPITGVEQGVQTDAIVVDERTFLNVSYDEWSRAKFYEIDSAGNAVERFEVPAYVESWLRVR
jgi:hypothetical protein